MSVCFSQDTIYFLPATVAAAHQCCWFRNWCYYFGHYIKGLWLQYVLPHHTNHNWPKSKESNKWNGFSTIPAALLSLLQGSVGHLALRNECFPTFCFPLFSTLFQFPFLSVILYLISVLEPCLLSSTPSLINNCCLYCTYQATACTQEAILLKCFDVKKKMGIQDFMFI